jgi:hypothetical protein
MKTTTILIILLLSSIVTVRADIPVSQGKPAKASSEWSANHNAGKAFDDD